MEAWTHTGNRRDAVGRFRGSFRGSWRSDAYWWLLVWSGRT